MKRVHLLSLWLLVGMFVVAIAGKRRPDVNGNHTLPELAKRNNAFALDLYRRLSGSQGNLFISPYSISTTLAMTYAGAKANTKKQMSQVLHFSVDQDKLHARFSRLQDHIFTVSQKDNVLLHVANSLWIQKGYNIKNGFLNIIKDTYGSSVQNVNFSKTERARKAINSWVEEHTKNKIIELIKPGFIDLLTRLVLVNAIYFKGDWENQFKESWTQRRPFYVSPQDSIMVPTMYQDKKFIYLKDSVCQLVELPYKGGELSMVVLLPIMRNGLTLLEKNLTSANLKAWTRDGMEQKVKLFLPRFAMASSFLLRETLATMGMADAFSEKANFSGITIRKDLQISEVIHKAYVKVDEQGSEAAAATAVVKRGLYMPEPPVEFKANHPFIFLIRDNYTGSILFLGRVIKPME